MDNFSPSVKMAGIVLLIGLIIFGMCSIVLITFMIVRSTSPSPTQTGAVTQSTAQVVNATPAPATDFPAIQTDAPPTAPAPSGVPRVSGVPTVSDTPPSTVEPTIQPAADFLSEYFRLINSRDYEATWAKLSDKYKTANNPDGYGQYTDFWDTVAQVDVLSPDVAYQHADTAKVSARLNLAYTNGKKGSQIVTFELVPDEQGTIWLIDDSY